MGVCYIGYGWLTLDYGCLTLIHESGTVTLDCGYVALAHFTEGITAGCAGRR